MAQSVRAASMAADRAGARASAMAGGRVLALGVLLLVALALPLRTPRTIAT